MSGKLCNDPLKISSHSASCSGLILFTEYKNTHAGDTLGNSKHFRECGFLQAGWNGLGN